MQPRVTIQALATVWLAVVGLVGAAVTHRLSHDQYFPASPHRHSRVQRNQIRDWRDPAEDQPLDLWIGSRRSIPAEELPALPHSSTKFTEQNLPLERSPKEDIVSSKRDYPFSAWQKWLLNIAGAEFEADKVDYGYEMPQTLSRETVILPSDLLDDPFVADDTFQDQGPGSVEIYKLDLSKENVLLTATTPTNDLLPKNKSKSPKKTSHLNSKTKTTEIKLTTTPSTKTHHEQSNVFEEQRTETPSVNTNSFGVGGVPELQVGCEGLEALSSSSSSSHKAKRSIDTPDKEQRQVPASILQDVTPISLDFDYDLTYDDEEEEMDELLKLKRSETTKKIKTNRGDMDASYLDSDHLSNQPDRLPVRGDLGESTHSDETRIERNESLRKIEIKNREEIKAKRMPILSDNDDGASKNRGRRLLWLAEANTEGFAYDKSEQKRAERSIDWGFGEDEGVVSSNELQTMNARRRKHDMRYHQDAARKRDQYYEVNSDINKIRREYEEHLAQKRRKEEEQRLRQQQQNDRKTPNRWMEEEERRRDEMRTRQYDEYVRKMNHIPASRTEDDEARRRQMEERQRDEEERRRRLQEDEKMRRRSQSKWQEKNVKTPNFRTPVYDEEKIRRSDEEMRREEEARRQEWYRKQQEAQRKKDEEERKRQEENRQREEQRRELERRRQEEEERRRQQPPSNLMDTRSQSRHPNDIERRDRDEERRMREDEEREKKLREYIARNQPINVNHLDQRSEEERRRYRPEYNRDSQIHEMNRNVEEYRRQMEEQHRRQEEEQRRRQEEEQRRRQEEEQRRIQEEEQRRRQEGEQRRRQEGEQRRRQEEEQRRRQEEEEKKLQDYIKRNQPIDVRNNQSTSRNLFEERRLIEQARRRDRYFDPEAGKHRGPSVSTYIDPRSSPEEIRRRQQETARRQEEERRRKKEREEKDRRLREEQMRKEAARREQEARREQSRRYEEERKRLEAVRLREERRRQEMLRERSRSKTERTRRPEATRPTYYQDPRLMEHRRRLDSHPIPSNLVRNEEERRKEREKQRLEQEAERRRQQNRWRQNRRNESEYERSRQELARLHSLPISARIIVHPINFTPSPDTPTVVEPRNNNEINFTGINPHREGVQVAKFPVAPTSRPPVPSPKPCVWAVVHCCSSNNSRLSKCFESLGCPGINWDPNPCSNSIVEAARAEIMKFYESQ
ncbi:trichohyalin-like isoform X2 [Pseudomyrmex gracilis]|nr:trichohyalin-like isoform X2 [Pseudomyrmex gracilis]XP_020287189.1 trichohyalin-like isoform X2 [Pseudomyrmex gracilis]